MDSAVRAYSGCARVSLSTRLCTHESINGRVLSSHDYDPEYVNLVRTVETYLQIIYLLLPILYHPVKIILACLYVVHEQTIL